MINNYNSVTLFSLVSLHHIYMIAHSALEHNYVFVNNALYKSCTN